MCDKCGRPDDFTVIQIKNDINGNPRFVVHFFAMFDGTENMLAINVHERYKVAAKLANKIGGRKYSTKRFGGGIVFQAYSEDEVRRNIRQLLEREAQNA